MVLEMALMSVQELARGMVLAKDLKLVLGMGQETDLEMVLATVRDLVLVSANQLALEKDPG